MTAEILRLLQASSCFREGEVCATLPCACAETLARISVRAQRAPTRRVPKVRTSHHRNKEEAARLQALVDKRCARGGDDAPALTSTPGQAIEKTDGGAS